MDVKSTFLNGFGINDQENKVYLLKKALYGLKQALRKSLSKATLYVKCVGPDILIIPLYVDDLLMTKSNLALIEKLKKEMMSLK
ncbi:hypothetical protein CR513_61334, partial [Mucuna pruriens]